MICGNRVVADSMSPTFFSVFLSDWGEGEGDENSLKNFIFGVQINF